MTWSALPVTAAGNWHSGNTIVLRFAAGRGALLCAHCSCRASAPCACSMWPLGHVATMPGPTRVRQAVGARMLVKCAPTCACSHAEHTAAFTELSVTDAAAATPCRKKPGCSWPSVQRQCSQRTHLPGFYPLSVHLRVTLAGSLQRQAGALHGRAWRLHASTAVLREFVVHVYSEFDHCNHAAMCTAFATFRGVHSAHMRCSIACL